MADRSFVPLSVGMVTFDLLSTRHPTPATCHFLELVMASVTTLEHPVFESHLQCNIGFVVLIFWISMTIFVWAVTDFLPRSTKTRP
jgi:uncharacterized membrane protein